MCPLVSVCLYNTCSSVGLCGAGEFRRSWAASWEQLCHRPQHVSYRQTLSELHVLNSRATPPLDSDDQILLPSKMMWHALLSSSLLNINSRTFFLLWCRASEDDFTLVDLAAMLGHHDIAKLLLSKGARDSTRCELRLNSILKLEENKFPHP